MYCISYIGVSCSSILCPCYLALQLWTGDQQGNHLVHHIHVQGPLLSAYSGCRYDWHVLILMTYLVSRFELHTGKVRLLSAAESTGALLAAL
jgi:hypothetical protein